MHSRETKDTLKHIVEAIYHVARHVVVSPPSFIVSCDHLYFYHVVFLLKPFFVRYLLFGLGLRAKKWSRVQPRRQASRLEFRLKWMARAMIVPNHAEDQTFGALCIIYHGIFDNIVNLKQIQSSLVDYVSVCACFMFACVSTSRLYSVFKGKSMAN